MIDQTLLHYKIVSQIGAGGMGVVYKAWDEHLDRYVAIKVLPPEKVADADRQARFIREAKAASALNHPNIITIHDVATDAGTLFIVMEHVEGRQLKDLISRAGMADDLVLKLAVQMAGAIAKAHDRGVIHRDLKPANILITQDQQAKILDFGLAKLLDRPGGAAIDSTITMEGAVLGTAAYMSPEQVQGQQTGPAADIFSFGIILYEMIAGRRPFPGPNSAAVMAAILQKDPVPLRSIRAGVNPELERLVFACLRKRPEERLHSAAELKGALEVLYGEASKSIHSSLPAVSESPSLAVLPFTNASSDKENDYFAEGLAEEIINALTRTPNLRVTARASSFAFRGPNYNIAEIGEKLHVGYVLDGGVRKMGDRLRVTVNLIKVSDSFQVWSERFDRTMTDIFEVQDEISAAVAEKLTTHLSSTGFRSSAPAKVAPSKTANVEAYNLYLKGRYYWNRRSWSALRRGIECFTAALELDPAYANAYVGLADSYNLLGYYSERPPKEAFPRAKAAAEKALRLDPANSGANAALGYAALFYDRDWAKADAALRKAIELDPENTRAHHWHAWYFFAMGRNPEGIDAMERAHAGDPLAPIVNDHLGLAYSLAGLHDKALEQLRQTIELDPGFFLAHYRLGWVHLHQADPAGAIAHLQRAVDLSGGTFGLGLLGYALGLAGRAEEATAIGVRLEKETATRYISPFETALVRAGLGDLDGSFQALNDAVRDRVSDLILYPYFPWTQSYRQDARYSRFLAQLDLEDASL